MPRLPGPARWGLAALLALGVVLLSTQAGPDGWLSLDALRRHRDEFVALHRARPVATVAAFFALYVATTALSIPGAALLTLAAGAVFGPLLGLLTVSFASSVGALLAFLLARTLLRDTVQARFGRLLATVDAGMARDGTAYLLMLRLVPAFPFWLVNLLMGLTTLPAARFYWVSQLGMLPATAIYVNAGTQLGAIDAPGDVLSPALLASLAALGLFPLVAKKLVERLRRRRVYAGWPRPARFDRNLIVIGAGAGGLVTAYLGAALRAKVTLVEADRMGGDCLNRGCVPSKALIRSARAARQLADAHAYGLRDVRGEPDFAAVMRRVRDVVRAIEPHDSIERYTALGVDVVQGHARLVSPWAVEIRAPDGAVRTLTARSIVIAAGSRPFVPPIPGLAEAGCLTSDTVWDLIERPARLVVLGGGPVGCELAQSFARLGSRVVLVESGPRLLGREDPEVGAAVEAALSADGVEVLTGHDAVRAMTDSDGHRLLVRPRAPAAADSPDGPTRRDAVDGSRDDPRDAAADAAAGRDGLRALPFDRLLCATGRRARVAGYGLEALGVPLNPDGTIETDAALRTRYPNIFAVGDVASPLAFTHFAAHQAWYATMNALFGRFRRFDVDDSVVPRATFTDPEVARVGLTEDEARARGVAFEVTRYALEDLDRAIVEGAAHGFVKVLTVPGRDRILGVTIVGEQAAELLAEYVLAMKHGLGLNRILSTLHAYPTMAEANKYAAGAWRRAHAPRRVLDWLERFHRRERG